MSAHKIKKCTIAMAVALASMIPVRAQVIVNNPNLPVVYPAGVFRTPDQVFAMHHGPGLAIVLNNVEQRASFPTGIHASGPDEIADFNSQMPGLVSVNGSPFQSAIANGPTTTVTFGKIGHITGTFNTEMLSLNVSGTSPFGPFMIRESPTLASTGQATVADFGGGLYRIDSFFDVFTELSIDGGASWIPADGPAHMALVPTPEPSTFALLGLGLIGFGAIQRRRQKMGWKS